MLQLQSNLSIAKQSCFVEDKKGVDKKPSRLAKLPSRPEQLIILAICALLAVKFAGAREPHGEELSCHLPFGPHPSLNCKAVL